jgi:Flp pilus assembly protein TadG
MTRASVQPNRRRAVAAVEFAALLPLILTLLLGIWDLGRLIEIQQLLTNAAREGGRQASTGQLTNSEVQAVVAQYLQVAGLPTSHVVVAVQDLTHTSADVSQAQYLDNLEINVTIPVADVRWTLLSFVTTPGQLIPAQVQWVTMVDKPYPSSPVPPIG